MAKDIEIIKENNAIPLPVRIALKVLKDLDPARRQKLKKPLCALAMTMAQAGKEVSEAILCNKLADGDETIIAPRAVFNAASGIQKFQPKSIMERYERLIEKMTATKPANDLSDDLSDDPTLPPVIRLERAAERGDTATLKEIISQDGVFDEILHFELRHILYLSIRGKIDMAEVFIDNKIYDAKMQDLLLERACRDGKPELLKILIDRNKDVLKDKEWLLPDAICEGHFDCVKLLVENGADVKAINQLACYTAANYHYFGILHYLLKNGGYLNNMNAEEHKELTATLKNIDLWLSEKGCYPPQGLEKLPVTATEDEIKNLTDVSALLQKEGYGIKMANLYAALALPFFETADRLMDYVERWAKPGKQPLHDVVHMLSDGQIHDGNENERDSLAWGEAMFQCGPEMAKLSVYSRRLPQPIKSVDGKRWSISRTRDEVSKIAFRSAEENLELAKLFLKNGLNEESFNKAVVLTKEYTAKGKNRIPDVTLNGKDLGISNVIFKKLPDGDLRGLILGQLTDCCQSIGSVGEECAQHGFRSENGGFYIVVANDNKKGAEEIIGQSWAWRGKQGELVLDSLETLGKRISGQQWERLTSAFADALKNTTESHDITALHIGKGGDTPNNMGFKEVTSPAEPLNYDGYRDSQSQYLVWKKKP